MNQKDQQFYIIELRDNERPEEVRELVEGTLTIAGFKFEGFEVMGNSLRLLCLTDKAKNTRG
jgi:hypothetical protein